MKRSTVLLVLMMVFLAAATAQAQQATPQQRGGAPADPRAGQDVLRVMPVLGELQLQAVQQPAGQRGAGGGGRGGLGAGGGRGGIGPGGGPVVIAPVNPDLLNGRVINPDGSLIANRVVSLQGGGAWWTNTNLLARLGLTDDQKLKIERVYESHRQNLVTSKELLEKEEAQLTKLLEAEPLDRTASIAQIYKAIQARGEMEKVNGLMTFEMREVLTRAQWTQLQAMQPLGLSLSYIRTQAPPTGTQGQRGPGGGGRGAGGPAGAGAPGVRGQQ